MKPQHLTLIPALALGLVLAGSALAQSGTGNLYRVTTKTEMVGMPFQMPAQTVEVCGPKNQTSEKMVPHDENCTVTDFKVSGNKSSYTMTCRGEGTMTAKGEFEQLGPDAYRGKMHMVGTADGERMEMNMTFDGKKIRDCDYATESPEAKGKAMMARSCEDMLKMPDPGLYQHFTGGDAMCASYKPRYCSAMLANSLTPAYIRQGDQTAANMPKGTPTFWDAFAACGTSRQAAIAKVCPMAEKAKDYAFLTDYCPDLLARACNGADAAKDGDFLVASCPAQAQAAAAKHCAGRDFTALRASPYAGFCSRYAAGSLKQRNQGAVEATPANEDKPAEDEKKRTWRDRLKSARDALGG